MPARRERDPVKDYLAAQGRKGGKARAENLTAAERKRIARSGGAARAKNMNATDRSEAARLAARARWSKKKPKS